MGKIINILALCISSFLLLFLLFIFVFIPHNDKKESTDLETVEVLKVEWEAYKEEHIENKYYWECVEYANKTIVNDEWFDNCCIKLYEYIADNPKEYSMDIDTKKFGIIAKAENNTTYKSGGFCFDIPTEHEKIEMYNQTINVTKCKETPRTITTNETICVTKRLMNYGQYKE